jgi:small subunit ribosomal protein S8
MPVTDPIADMLTCIRNAIQARHRRLDVPLSRVKLAIAEVLKKERYISDFKTVEDGKQGILRIYLRYGEDQVPLIKGIERVSRPGLRIYVKRDEIPKILQGMGTAIISTSQGMVADKEARRLGLGGEVVATIW